MGNPVVNLHSSTEIADAESKKLAKTIDDRLSQELVFALVGPVGSGCSTTASELKKELENTYKYMVPEIISVSAIIRRSMHLVGVESCEKSNLEKYVASMQDAGNALRKRFGEDYLSKRIVESIHRSRKSFGAFDEGAIIPKRIAYVIDSIKNLDELRLLRKIYKETLVLVGVFAPDAQRSARLNFQEVYQKVVDQLFQRDKGEKWSFGQATRKVFTQSDWFVCNDSTLDELKRKIRRFLGLVFDIGVQTPTKAEAAMYKANAVAGNSACLSRQVGATIVSSRGEFIGMGWNDVPKFGGGLYDEDTKTESAIDNRCYNWGGNCCHNEVTRNGITRAISSLLLNADFVKKGTKLADVVAHLSDTPVDALTEFSRSIHAEMEAILSVAREGKHSLVGSTLYTNTYPCHNCARHIVASGIVKVVYIEPYLKSHATKLHYDAITEDPADSESKVFFQQFDGIAPRNYLKFFRSERDRKAEGGTYLKGDVKNALPRLRIALDGPARYEDLIMVSLLDLDNSVGGV
ncbi:anti-phage dCTP deaminase [Tabrizicola sp.]|uniref:anti-phage dCTP deaminase n=1 Tax=Tabrizicola sp. TaxID=2005166 RepID=UPI001A611708|nr:anti-phage dCTP deaminase [Tabrizicola sp.]MBL9074548.1 hypothetical protein [Tabrizicola sp.]